MTKVVVAAIGPAGKPWGVVYDGTNGIVDGTSFHVKRGDAEVEAWELSQDAATLEAKDVEKVEQTEDANDEIIYNVFLDGHLGNV